MKLEDITKKNIFKVPDEYFDDLPMRIQSRIDEEKTAVHPGFDRGLIWKIAAPALAAILMIFFFINRPESDQVQSPEELLSQVSTEDVIAYLEMTDITTDDIIEEIDFSDINMEFDEGVILDLQLDEEEIDVLLDDYGIDNETL